MFYLSSVQNCLICSKVYKVFVFLFSMLCTVYKPAQFLYDFQFSTSSIAIGLRLGTSHPCWLNSNWLESNKTQIQTCPNLLLVFHRGHICWFFVSRSNESSLQLFIVQLGLLFVVWQLATIVSVRWNNCLLFSVQLGHLFVRQLAILLSVGTLLFILDQLGRPFCPLGLRFVQIKLFAKLDTTSYRSLPTLSYFVQSDTDSI